MYISKSRFINWTRCPMYFPMELKHNPSGKHDIDIEREHRMEMLEELSESMASTGFPEEDDEKFDATLRPELEALLPYYNQVEEEALRVARSISTALSSQTLGMCKTRNSANMCIKATPIAATWIYTTRTSKISTSSR